MNDVSECKRNGSAGEYGRLPARADVFHSSTGGTPAGNGKAGARKREALDRNWTIRLTSEEYDEARAYAAKHGVRMSQFGRVLLAGELEDEAAMTERRAMAELPLAVARIEEQLARMAERLEEMWKKICTEVRGG